MSPLCLVSIPIRNTIVQYIDGVVVKLDKGTSIPQQLTQHCHHSIELGNIIREERQQYITLPSRRTAASD